MKWSIAGAIGIALGVCLFLFIRPPYLREMAEKHGYGLKADQVLGRVPPPFPKARDKYYRVSPSYFLGGGFNPDTTQAMIFFWDGKRLKNWGGSYYTPYTLVEVLTSGTTILRQDIEGPTDLLDMRLYGDWVLRPEAPEEKLLQDMEAILQNQFNTRVRLKSIRREQPVYIARGTYQFKPLDHDPTNSPNDRRRSSRSKEIKIFEQRLDLSDRGADGKFYEFLSFVGTSIGTTIVDEVSNPPQGMLSWMRYSEEKSDPEEPPDQELILKNITAQTGLTFKKDLREIRRILVERIE